MSLRSFTSVLYMVGVACSGDPDPHADPIVADDPHPEVTVSVTLDGRPVADARLTQGGLAHAAPTFTDHNGRARVTIDPHVGGELVVMASVPSARIGAATWTPSVDPEAGLTIALTSFEPTDNPDYAFQDPGEPTRRDTSAQCSHCHLTLGDDWFASPHRTSAKNPTVQALYRGTVQTDEAGCAARRGTWVPGSTIKGRPEPARCYAAAGVLPDLNPAACADGPCDGTEAAFGACADCHAPGMDGPSGGRDLAQAEGHALDYGVHCDVCHRVESIDPALLAAPAGVAGRLRLHRPSEPSPSLALGRFLPITFGPHHDVANPRMGLVQRDHFHEATLCAGCHELDQAVLVPGHAIDSERWPSGTLPVHSTYSEWAASSLNPVAPCQSCHMPPAAEPWNGADLQAFPNVDAGIAAGWPRPPGSVRHHRWIGPRTRASMMLERAASVTIDKTLTAEHVEARVTVKNVGPGHALPTGEPLRSVLLMVQARCEADPIGALEPIGGDVIADIGGFLDRKAADEDWGSWPGAAVGDHLRIVNLLDEYVDYDGVGPFALAANGGRFAAAEKGIRREVAVAARTIVAVDGDVVTLDRPLPEPRPGDVAYRVRPPAEPADIVDGSPASAWAGAPGVVFARVLVGADGLRMVPHFLAVDVASDNRLRPGASWTSVHRFARETCAADATEVTATLVHRAYPLDLARERGWPLVESVMAEVRR